MMRPLSVFAAVSVMGLVVAARMTGQTRPPGEVVTTLGGAYSNWRFSTAAPQDSITVTRVSQAAIPVSASVTAGRWTFDAGFAVAVGTLRLGSGRSIDLSGVGDLRVRGVGHLIQDRVLIVLGVNAPTGKTKLVGDEIDAIRVLGAPALRMPVANLGMGPGGTGGLVFATRAGPWNVGIGGSFEIRGSYSPIESRIAGLSVPTDLEPGTTFRGSLGLDRTFGTSRLSVLLAGERYSRDQITLRAPGGGAVTTSYRLGPQLFANLFLELGVKGFRTFTLTAADRYRTAYTGPTGGSVAGSSGNALEVGIQGITGVAGRTGFLFRVDGWVDGGLEVDNTITTAAMNAVGVTLGISVPAGRASVQPFVRGQLGQLDTGPTSTRATGFGAGIKMVLER